MAVTEATSALAEAEAAAAAAAATATKRKNRPVVNPPRGNAINDAGILVVFAPRAKKDDPTLGANDVITHKMCLPLTPDTMSIASSNNINDGIYSLRGDEHSTFGGAQLDQITFSARLEPPDFYINRSKVTAASSIQSGQFTPLALDVVHTADGRLIVDASGVETILDPNAETTIQQKDFGRTYATPPLDIPGTDVVMSSGAVAPPGFYWHEPHDMAAMLRDACRGEEVFRLIIGDQYGINMMVTLRTFTWNIQDPDPDVINIDCTFKEWRPHSLPRAPSKHAKDSVPASYKTTAGDTLHSIAGSELGDPNRWSAIVTLNQRELEQLYVYTDGRADAAEYQPANESVGPKVDGEAGHRVGKIRHVGLGVHPDTYLRAGIRLKLKKLSTTGKASKSKKKTHDSHASGS